MTDQTTRKQISPVLKQVLELGPTLIFFVAYLRMRDETFTIAGTEYSGFIMAALVFIPVLLVAMGILWALTGNLSRMQVFTAFMVIFFGALTAWFNDERFFKMKTSIVYATFAAILGFGLWRGRSYLEYVMGEYLPMTPEGWMIFTRRLVIFCIAMAVLNEIVWRTMSTDAWVAIETFGFPVLTMVFLFWQMMQLQEHVEAEEDSDSGAAS